MQTKAEEPVVINPEDAIHDEDSYRLSEVQDKEEDCITPESAPLIPIETMKKIVWACLINGILWVWASYILAALDKVQIAESLSQVALKEIIAVVFVYAVKSLFENLSKNNKWPDKPPKDDKSGLG